MALPLAPNNTCDIYRTGNAPPNPPDVAGVSCYLFVDFQGGQEHGEGDPDAMRWSHKMQVDLNVDVRDDYDAGTSLSSRDQVYIPDQNGTAFDVVFVEVKARGLPGVSKKVYLTRHQPNWPSNNL